MTKPPILKALEKIYKYSDTIFTNQIIDSLFLISLSKPTSGLP